MGNILSLQTGLLSDLSVGSLFKNAAAANECQRLAGGSIN